eukprot:m.97945 g.97945  ORF g.97945 m.97945 type:complete len:782 (-) comp13619_c0_seq1:114-2459(-)
MSARRNSTASERGIIRVTIDRQEGKSIGLAFEERENGVVLVSKIQPNSPAEKTEQISPGYRVLAVNNIKINESGKPKVIKLIKETQPGAPVRFILRDPHARSRTNSMNKNSDSFIKVSVNKVEGRPLGISIQGPAEDNSPTPGIFISKISPNGIVAETGRFQVGQEVLAVNGVNVTRRSKHVFGKIVKDSPMGSSINFVLRASPVNKNPTPSPAKVEKAAVSEADTPAPKYDASQDPTREKQPEEPSQSKDIPAKKNRFSMRRGPSKKKPELKYDKISTLLMKSQDKPMGLSLHESKEGVFISVIKPDGTAAENSELCIGQQILEIEGVSTSKATKERCVGLVKAKAGDVKIVVQLNPKGFASYDDGKLLKEETERAEAEVKKNKEEEKIIENIEKEVVKESETVKNNIKATEKKTEDMIVQPGVENPQSPEESDKPPDQGRIQLGKVGKIWESLESEGALRERMSSFRHIINQKITVRTTIKITGIPNISGLYTVEEVLRNGMPVYFCAPDKYLQYVDGHSGWGIVTKRGIVLAVAPGDFVRPHLITTVWNVLHGNKWIRWPQMQCSLFKKPTGFYLQCEMNPSVILSNTTLGYHEVADICAELKDPATRIQELKSLYGSALHFCSYLLIIVRLHKIFLEADHIQGLVEACSQNHTLKHLQLRETNVTDDCCEALGSMLSQNTTLEILSLRGNKISAQGLKGIIHGLVRNNGLELLSLGENELLDTGVLQLMLPFSFSLKGIAVYDCGISDRVAQQIHKRNRTSTCYLQLEKPTEEEPQN